jgi:Zn-finger nucleic acid-binding protein
VEPESCGFEASLVNQRCHYACIDSVNYKLIGTKVARCKRNGLWKENGGLPKCIERKSRKKSRRKNNKKHKKKKNNEHKTLGHPLSTIAGDQLLLTQLITTL